MHFTAEKNQYKLGSLLWGKKLLMPSSPVSQGSKAKQEFISKNGSFTRQATKGNFVLRVYYLVEYYKHDDSSPKGWSQEQNLHITRAMKVKRLSVLFCSNYYFVSLSW